MKRRIRTASITAAAAAAALFVALTSVAPARPATPGAAAPIAPTFATGQPQATTVGAAGCGTNQAGEPSIHVSKAGLVELGSENGLGGGSVLWRGVQRGGVGASPCRLVYAGQPNTVTGGVGASGGDIDTAFAPVPMINGVYRLYVASLNLASVNVATSTDNGKTFRQSPVQVGLPGDDREWIAAWGPATSLLSFHDIATNNIDILRSDDGGQRYTHISRAIPDTDPKAQNNELGNLVIDHRNPSPTAGGFWAYQSFVAPSTATGSTYNEAFVAVSSDGGHTWTDRPVPCSTRVGANGLGHNFPNISVAPNGSLWYAYSNDTNVYTATSSDHGATWTCSPAVNTTTPHAIFPWLVATSAGVDLVYYGQVGTGASSTWYVEFAQNPTSTIGGWAAPHAVVAVHRGAVCEGGVDCTSGRQLYDDFGVDTDRAGWAHIAYSHDAPNLGGSGTYTGYAVQTGGTPLGIPN
ncbi:MAG: hypothetical protein JWM05_11 [Acidimicrobiales bacterium]|nr:hypothetical protein [Acidimicrobiales bacterium]